MKKVISYFKWYIVLIIFTAIIVKVNEGYENPVLPEVVSINFYRNKKVDWTNTENPNKKASLEYLYNSKK